MRTIVASVVAFAILPLIYWGLLPGAFGLAALLFVAVGVYWPLRDRVQEVLLVFVSIFLLMIVIGSPHPRLSRAQQAEELRHSWAASGRLDDRLPVVLHLVFDEMMSPGAIDTTLPTGASTREALYALGARYGLRTFDSVYSRSFFSGVSLPNLFNVEHAGQSGQAPRSTKPLERVRENAYFDEMAQQGYRTVVFQTSVMNFCANDNVDMCETFPSFDPDVPGAGGSDLASRTLHLSKVLLGSYDPSYVSRFGRWLLSPGGAAAVDARRLGTADRFDVQGFPAWFDRFIGFVEGVPRGTHVFTHVLVPHGPYLLSGDCATTGEAKIGYYLGSRFTDLGARAQARREYFTAYFAQVDCVRSRLAAFFEAVNRNPALQDARIIIHGDHGSRISVGNLFEDYEEEDYVANYGTYFAVRAPGIQAGLDCRFLSLAEAFRESGVAPGLPPLDRSNPPVVVQSKVETDAFIEAPMPRFGCTLEEPSARER